MSEDVWDVWAIAESRDACMVFEIHSELFEDRPIGVPPAIHCRLLVLQSCDDDNNCDLLAADGRVSSKKTDLLHDVQWNCEVSISELEAASFELLTQRRY